MNSPAPAAPPPAHPLAGRDASPRRPLSDTTPAKPEVFDLRDRITILTPTYDFAMTEVYHATLERFRRVTARFRMPDGSIQMLPVMADRINVPNDSHIDRARNVTTYVWYKQNQTRFALTLDADIEAHEPDLVRTWTHLMQGEKFVGGLYAMKCLQPTFVANCLAGKKADPVSGLLSVLHAGTGFLAFERSVITDLIAEWPRHVRGVLARALVDRLSALSSPLSALTADSPEISAVLSDLTTVVPGFDYKASPNTPFAGETQHAIFASGPIRDVDGSSTWLSEDWMLCHRWRQLRGDDAIKMDTQIKLRHLGRMLYPPPVSELQEATLAMITTRHPALDLAKLKAAIATAESQPKSA